MDEFIWDERYSVHNALLDGQHETIFNILNKIDKHQQHETGNSEFISESLTLLRESVAEHLHCEEEILKKVYYPNLQEHKKHHKKLKEVIAMSCFQIMNKDESAISELLTYMRDCWLKHLLDEDKQYVPFVQEDEELVPKYHSK